MLIPKRASHAAATRINGFYPGLGHSPKHLGHGFDAHERFLMAMAMKDYSLRIGPESQPLPLL